MDEGQLKKIPRDLIENMRDAAVLLDERQCLKAAETIGDHNPELGRRLRRMVENLKYRKMLSVFG